MKPKRTEADMAAQVQRWLEVDGWDVYPEVQMSWGSRRADLVGKRGSILWVIETKMSLTWSLLDQALAWRAHAQLVSIAIPWKPYDRARAHSPMLLCRAWGIGVLRVRDPQRGSDIEICQYPDFNKRLTNYLALSLHPDQQRATAGGTSSGSNFSTPFKRTMDAARFYISKNPGCTAKEIVKHVEHHYSNDRSARSCLVRWLQDKEIGGVYHRAEHGGLRFWSSEPT